MTKLEIQLYKALKGLEQHWEAMASQEAAEGGFKYSPSEDELLVVARDALMEVDMSLGPLPDWATAHNLAREAVQYAQLCTRDGERMGNAILAAILPLKDSPYYVISDMGNPMRLTGNELAQLFTVGPYIMDKNAVMKRKRQNPEAFGDQL